MPFTRNIIRRCRRTCSLPSLFFLIFFARKFLITFANKTLLILSVFVAGLFAILFIVANLVTDILYTIVDPRVSLQ